MAGTALGEPEVQISWQAQHLVNLECRFRRRHSAWRTRSADISWQAQDTEPAAGGLGGRVVAASPRLPVM